MQLSVCDGSAPFLCGGSAEPVQNIHPGKPQRKAPAPGPTQGSSSVKVGFPQPKGGSGRGRTLPRGHHGSSVTGLFVPSEQENGLQSTARLTLLWYFLQEPQNLHPSPTRVCS